MSFSGGPAQFRLRSIHSKLSKIIGRNAGRKVGRGREVRGERERGEEERRRGGEEQRSRGET